MAIPGRVLCYWRKEEIKQLLHPQGAKIHTERIHTGYNKQTGTVKADGTVPLSCSSENFAKSYACISDNENY